MPQLTAGAPVSPSTAERVARIMSTRSPVNVPPFVSHRHQRRGTRIARRAGARDRVGRIITVAVEVMLEVEEDLPTGRTAVGHRVADHGEVLISRGAQDVGDVEQPGLADERNDRRASLNERSDVRVVLDAVGTVPGEAEGRESGVPPRHRSGRGEELGVLRVGARPAAFDEGHTEVVKAARDLELVDQRNGKALALVAVSKRGVVEKNRLTFRARRLCCAHPGAPVRVIDRSTRVVCVALRVMTDSISDSQGSLSVSVR